MFKSFMRFTRGKDRALTDNDRPKAPHDHPAYAGVQQSFNHKLSTRLFFVILCTALLALTIVAPTYRDYTLSRQNLYDIQHYRLILDTANYLSAERGPANIVMSEGPSSDSAGSKRLVEFRARTDAALAQVASELDAPFGLRDQKVPPDMLVRVHDQLVIARAKVDRIASIPRPLLTLPEIQDAIECMFEVSDRYQAITAWSANEFVQHDTDLAAPALVGQMLSDLRDYGGRVASQIIAPVVTGQKMPLKNVIDSKQSQGRLLELWRLIGGQTALYDIPALAENRNDIERLFFRDGIGLVDRVIDEGRRKPSYSLSATEFTDRFVPTMRPIETYPSAFLDAAVDTFAEARTKALTTLAAVTLFTATILAILVGAILSMRIHIFRPLIHARDELIRLAEDHPIAVPSRSTQAGEILSLFHAIEILQGKLQERASITSELRVQAETDGLTALLNRRMLDQLGQSLMTAESTNDALCLILIDIDHFKAVNDTFGHITGDRVLIQTAELLRSLLRASEFIARFGGEEFAVLVPGNDLSGAISIARKIRMALQQETYTTPDGTPFNITASFGVARGRRGESAWRQLVELADAELYRAKADGRNRVRFARDTLPAQTRCLRREMS
ncbi:diguanylate cyclase [Rhizobium leguminosarum bv. viciae]|nr:diguanylate cyclase [Rhizobium leguminosarum bv. viciae]